MRKLNIISLVFTMGIFSGCVFHVSVDSLFPIRGNGNLITSENSVSSFEKINISGSAQVRFYESQEYRTVVTVDSNLLEYTEIVTRGNTLNVRTKNGNYLFTEYLVDVYCPAVTDVSVSGSGNFEGMDSINVSTFTSKVSGSGKIDGAIECENFYAKISGSGRITVSGNGGDSDIDIAGSGVFNGKELSVHKATVRISGSGKADINVSENLDAHISGSGEINYRGNPIINSKISGSGRIRNL